MIPCIVFIVPLFRIFFTSPHSFVRLTHSLIESKSCRKHFRHLINCDARFSLPLSLSHSLLLFLIRSSVWKQSYDWGGLMCNSYIMTNWNAKLAPMIFNHFCSINWLYQKYRTPTEFAFTDKNCDLFTKQLSRLHVRRW